MTTEIKLRDYQDHARREVYRSLREHRSTLLVLPTGCGKTIVFAKICKDGADNGKRMLVLAHRSELVEQAAEKIGKVAGCDVAVEQAERKEAQVGGLIDGAPVVVGSVQSMVKRLDRFPADHFNLIIVDEAHHAIAKTYRDIIAHFSGAKVLGVTATPERGDGTALRAVFDDVAFDMSLSDAVTAGWLTPIRSKIIELEHLNLSECRSRAGDLAAGDLDEIMSEVKLLREMAEPTIEHCIGRPTIVFTVTVAHAHVFAQTLREVAEERGLEIVVEALDGTTDKALRKAQVARYQAGEIHILVNCMLFTEGFDAPATACIVMGRPTKSRSLYMQMLGRGTRPLGGTVDGVAAADMMVAIDGHMEAGRIDPEAHAKIIAEVHQGSDAAARRAAIAVSAKTDVLVLDFTGDSGKHDLVQAVDLLGGSALEERLLAEARDRVRNGYDDIFAALAAVRAEHDSRVMKVQIRAGNAFALLGVDPPQDRFPQPATQNQKDFLERKLKGVKKGDLKRMTKAEANVLITAIMQRQDANLCTFKQARLLTKHGFDPIAVRGLPFMDASGLISELANNDWKAPKGWGDSVGNTSQAAGVGGA